MQDIVKRLKNGDRRALARMVTLIESGAPEVPRYLADLYRHTGRAHIIGITGSPGAGKSSLVTGMVRILRQQDYKVGVIAVDPSSPFTGGAILGDRIRMMELAGDSGVFIRSMASRGSLGGLSATTQNAVRALDAAGYDIILIETVGTGQAEVEIMNIAQTVIVVLAPGMGDDVQAIKAGILEIADIFVVSKADKPGADQTVAELNMLLSLDPERRSAPWRLPILKTSAYKNEGIDHLITTLKNHRDYLNTSGTLAQRAQRQVRSEIERLIVQAILQKLQHLISDDEWQTLTRQMLTQERDPYSVASDLLERLEASNHS